MISELVAVAMQLIPLWETPCKEATLLFAGDAMQHTAQIEAAKRTDGNYDYSECFNSVSDIISSADYAVVNLETPIAKSSYSGYPCFNAPSSFASALKNAGFDLFLTANNHTLDRRETGMRQTLSALDSLQVDHIGTYSSENERCQRIPFIKDINGFQIGFLNYTYGTNGFIPRDSSVVDYIDRTKIASDIKQTREAGAELVCVTIHWGDEYHSLPNKSQNDLVTFLSNQGVELIIGSHPHVVQPIKLIDSKEDRLDRTLVVYSLGNFISNMKTRDTRGGIMVKANLIRDIHGNPHILNASYIPVFTVPAKGNFNFYIINGNDVAPAFAEPMRLDFMRSLNNLMEKHNENIKTELTKH